MDKIAKLGFYILLLSCIYYVNKVDALKAYDCNHDFANITAIDLTGIADCPIVEDSNIKVDSVMVQVIQEKQWVERHVYHCSISMTTLIYHCGMHSHMSLVNSGYSTLILPISHETCMDIYKTNTYHYGIAIISGLQSNSTSSHTLTLAGQTSNDGSCKGQSYAIPGNSYDNVVVIGSFTITLKDYNALYEIKQDNMVLGDGTICKIYEHECIHSVYGYTFWEMGDNDKCHDTSRDVLYEGIATITYKDDIYEKSSVITVNRDNHLFSLVVIKPGHVCHQKAYITDHSRIFVIKQETYGFYFKPSYSNPRNIDLTMYMNSKLTYAVGHIETQIKNVYTELTTRDCMIERSSLYNKIMIARHHPLSLGNIITDERGYMNIIAGEVMYVIKCQPVEVILRKIDYCSTNLPVTYKNSSMFMEPVAHILTNTSMQVPCSDIIPVMYNLQNSWYSFSPSPHKAIPPVKLSPSISSSPFVFHSLGNLMNSGIYSSEALEDFRKFVSFPMIRLESSSYVASKLSHMNVYRNSVYDSTDLIDPYSFNKMTKKALSDMFGWFIQFGSIMGGLYGIIIVYKLVSKLLSIMINSWMIYNAFGCGIKIIASLLNSCTHLIMNTKKPTDKTHTQGNYSNNESDVEGDNFELEPKEESHHPMYPSVPQISIQPKNAFSRV
jgi:hypothetical protein